MDAFSLTGTARLQALYVPNYPHGLGAIDYIAKIRTLLLEEVGRAPALSVSAVWDWNSGTVVAHVGGSGPGSHVILWCSRSLHFRDDNKLFETSNTTCRSSEMQPTDNADMRQRLWARV